MGHHVLFISFAVTYFTQRTSFKSLRFGGLKKIASRFYWYQPPSFLPSSQRAIFGKVTSLARQMLLKIVIGFTSKTNRVFFISFPDEDSMSILRRQSGVPIIYNVHDRLVDEQGVWVDGHEELLRRADIILCGSQLLVAEIKAGTDKAIHYFPPGIDFEIFPRSVSFQEPRSAKKVVVGFIGSLGTQIDWPMLRAVAAQLTEFEFRFIGPLTKSAKATLLLQDGDLPSNVCFRPTVLHSEIPSVIAEFDVCIIPYLMNEYTSGINPLKLYEYMAFGKPIVSSPIPAVKHYKDLVYIASSIDEWKHQLRKASLECDNVKFSARQNAAMAEGYENRTKTILDLLQSASSALSTTERSV
jgi:glycosyltransferase involved in cell wall biosynthesis